MAQRAGADGAAAGGAGRMQVVSLCRQLKSPSHVLPMPVGL